MDSSGSKSDDFRSVIDDLTVENKKLRQRLRKYEERQCSHLQDDKLFEVRIHGLSAHKRRELEETLRGFASRLEESPVRPDNTSSLAPSTSGPFRQPSQMDSSASTSYSRPADSAYASMIPSGETNVGKLYDEPPRVRYTKASERNIDSSLHTMSQGLPDRGHITRTEKAKKKLVVRKLEELFTGKAPASENCRQRRRHQEVSQLAAEAGGHTNTGSDRRDFVEGVREARILPADSESTADGTSDERVPAQLRSTNNTGCSSYQVKSSGLNGSSNSSPEQRPTRPMDIDPNRVQVPADNVEYIRHLGFSSQMADANASGEGVEGWIYLNLLMSMAQLHTINVTADFVRKAIAEVSDRFELSRDRRRIRWRGGTEGTRISSDGCSSGDQYNEKSPTDKPGPTRKRRRLGNDRSSSGNYGAACERGSSPEKVPQHSEQRPVNLGNTSKRRRVFLGQGHQMNQFDYKPLFLHTTGLKTAGEWCLPICNSMKSLEPAGDGTSIVSASQNSPDVDMVLNPLEPNHNDGPIIFYRGATFCTDFSGDLSHLSDDTVHLGNQAPHPLGSVPVMSNDALVNAKETRQSLGMTGSSFNHVDHENDEDMDARNEDDFRMYSFDLEVMHSVHNDVAGDGGVPLELEASGVGGVQPLDNFAINVHVRYMAPSLGPPDTEGPVDMPQQSISALHRATLTNKSRKATVRNEIISAIKVDLAPSSLPPPSYYLSLSTSETDDDNESQSDLSDSGLDVSHSSPLIVDPSAAKNTIHIYRTIRSQQSLLGPDQGFEDDTNLDADDDAW
ncbi:hypothetical protein MMC16_003317 [Acarospora aff. strigata]|nr:hypothetical protein [Acarospora aff. strigata]